MDTVPQRRLLDLLRVEIDKAMASGRLDGTLLLIEANPRSALSSHVLYNLGERRVRWLSRVLAREAAGAARPPLPFRREASSNSSVRRIEKWWSDA